MRWRVLLAATFCGLVAFMAMARGTGWTSGDGLHTTLEACATMLALGVATLALVRFYSRKESVYLVIGAGFLGTAVLDAYHMLATMSWFASSLPSRHSSLIGWSWMATRSFQALVLALAWWAWRREHRHGEQGRIDERRFYWLVLLLVVGAFLAIATLPMPPAYVEGVFHRPAEFVPGLLFLLTFVGFYRKQRVDGQPFDLWLMLSLLFGFASHVLFMSLSAHPFDAMFDAAHVLKLGGYLLILQGLLLSVHHAFRRVDENAHVLAGLNDTLRREVAERQRREQQLLEARDLAESANRAKSQFLANMSHELRTPLNSVIGFANILRKNKSGALSERELHYLERILDNGRHLLSLINDVLDLSKIEAGRLEVQIEPVRLGELVPQVLGQFESLVRESGVQLRIDLPEQIAPLPSDEHKLRQVLVNLVGNAVKFTHEGAVTVRVVTDPATSLPVRLDVIDSGIGVPADRLEAVFESFTQAESGTDRKYGGTGLGLSISRSLCRLLHHDLVADSIEGQGSTFSILLDPRAPHPRHGESSGRATDPFSTTHDGRGSGTRQDDLAGRLVLIIDDNRDCLTLTRHYAEETGCRVLICGSGSEGLELARQHDPDLVVLDLMMPGMDGWEVLDRFGTDPHLRHIPVVVVSIVGRENESRLDTAAEVLNKPLDRAELFAALNRHLVRGNAEPGAEPRRQVGAGR